ncbi:MAG: PaaX family transcriptional regulator C-terminal domain-containing protein [Patescibacteria group bacterium]
MRISERILLESLIVGEQIFNVVKKPFRDRFKRNYWLFPWLYHEISIGRTINYLLKTTDIEKVVEKGKSYYKLTGRGKEKLYRKYPVLDLAKKEWDGKWRVVIFDIPEKKRQKRDNLRYKLKQLGFGQWQESVYITPHDIGRDLHEALEIMGLLPFVFVSEVKQTEGMDSKELSNKVWKLKDLENRYYQWILRAEKILELKDLKKTDIEQLFNEYEMILLEDPALPEQLLPGDWPSHQAEELIKKFYE